MGYVLLGILAGIGLPVQTSVNNRLKPRVGGPERTSLISFFVGSVFLLLWVLATEGTARLPVDRTAGYPFWIWTGGAFGVCFLLGNLFLISRVGSANTVIYPVVGQIIMGLLVDHFGWFMSDVQKLTILRAMGGALVLVGMLVITGTGKEAGTESRPGSWQAPVIGIGIGALSAAQTAINARLGNALDNPIQAALVSFSVGTVLLLMICLLPGVRKQPAGEEHVPVWTCCGAHRNRDRRGRFAYRNRGRRSYYRSVRLAGNSGPQDHGTERPGTSVDDGRCHYGPTALKNETI